MREKKQKRFTKLKEIPATGFADKKITLPLFRTFCSVLFYSIPFNEFRL